jgi:hypothetical protein
MMVFTYHFTTHRLVLPPAVGCVLSRPSKTARTKTAETQKEKTDMSRHHNSEKVHNYIESEEERESGHADTRKYNLGCDHPLGCNLGVDVAG